MSKFYEIHDSLLESLEQEGERVSIRLRAVRTEIDQKTLRPANYLRQEICLILDGAELSIDSSILPNWLLEGSFRCEASDADETDYMGKETIPASLSSARGVDLVLAGLHEGSGDFVTIRVRAKSLTIQSLGQPQQQNYTRASI
jgi:hypothetical protein